MLESELPELNTYPLEYPLNSPNNAVLVDMQSNNPASAGLFALNVQFKVRETHPSKGEATSYQIKNVLDHRTDIQLGGLQVVLVQSVNPVPLFMGKDSNGNYLYSNNFRFLMNEGGNK
jgi:hypothetical protein